MDHLPKLLLQGNQTGNQRLIPLNPNNPQLLTTDQHSHIGRLVPRDCQLVHHLQLHILGHAIAPQAGAMDARSFAFQDLHIASADHLTVHIRQHPGMLRVLQDRIHAAHLVASALGVMRRHNGLQQRAPEHGAGVIQRVDGWQEIALARLEHPQLQLRLVRVQPHGCGSIGAANTGATHFQPIITRHVLGGHQAQCSPFAGRAGRGDRRCCTMPRRADQVQRHTKLLGPQGCGHKKAALEGGWWG